MEEDDDTALHVTLPGLEDWIAEPIRRCGDDGRLRRFACAISSYLFDGLEPADADCLSAISVAIQFSNGEATEGELDAAHHLAAMATERIDKRERDTLDAFDEGRASYVDMMHSFVHARACMAATACTRKYARVAAAIAAYEGMHGLAAKSDLIARQKLERLVKDIT